VRNTLDVDLGSTTVLLDGGTSKLEVGILRKSWPADVKLAARALYGPGGCTGAKPNGPWFEKPARFPEGTISRVPITIAVPPMSADGDGDGFSGPAGIGA